MLVIRRCTNVNLCKVILPIHKPQCLIAKTVDSGPLKISNFTLPRKQISLLNLLKSISPAFFLYLHYSSSLVLCLCAPRAVRRILTLNTAVPPIGVFLPAAVAPLPLPVLLHQFRAGTPSPAAVVPILMVDFRWYVPMEAITHSA